MIYKIKPEGSREIFDPNGDIEEVPVSSHSLVYSNGALLSVQISQPLSVAERIQTKSRQTINIKFNALIDTGASITVISPSVAEQLNLVHTGFNQIASVHNVEKRPVYYGRVTFPWGASVEISLVSCDLQGIDCLIGRDIIKNWVMIFDGVNGEITICD